VGARIELASIPIANEWRESVSPQQSVAWALSGGDDYRLCFTAAPQHQALLQQLDGLHCIGAIVEAGNAVGSRDIVVVDKNGEPYLTHDNSYRHF
jgi:thiamine-monophosphate kinase